MANFLGSPKVQYFKTGTAEFLVGGKLYSYLAGTDTPTNTYPTLSDADASTNANTNPVILDARGEANVVLSGSTKLVLKDSSDIEIWTVDNINTTSTSGNDALQYVLVASAVNKITITNAATGNAPSIKSSGTDANIGLSISSKGSGTLKLDGGATGDVEIASTSTGAINLRRNTTAHGTLTVTGNTTFTGGVNLLPAGIVMWYGFTTAPTGWLECNGSAVSRTTYANLFAVIGTTFGTGDGSTTFNLPNQARRVIVGRGGSGTGTLGSTIGSTGGAETHTLQTTEMPAHTHTYNKVNAAVTSAAGATNVTATVGDINTGSTGGGTAHNNMQPSLVMMMIIRSV